ncbi:hypothetical protein L228DRAFT_10209 [Xylona heveae TC161]|uniref:Uncharacterized protein n=1 Tax=Xylona heveae (strain CBS 132557 / TC161) TaxID=1328760 RepID=A0A165JJT8_XYLHT|nr:hypothetical protein L228DRAFT_10209 [Xylona heveae TC161]KZF26327.1 hypothetical protein L228DRAFT_10209 [Xylona heveae TC161]
MICTVLRVPIHTVLADTKALRKNFEQGTIADCRSFSTARKERRMSKWRANHNDVAAIASLAQPLCQADPYPFSANQTHPDNVLVCIISVVTNPASIRKQRRGECLYLVLASIAISLNREPITPYSIRFSVLKSGKWALGLDDLCSSELAEPWRRFSVTT